MKQVAKYNVYKGISTALTVGTPIATLACCGDFIVQRSSSTVSAAGVFALLISLLFCKDKIAEQLKAPSAFVVSAVVFGLIILVENIIAPMKIVCITSMISSGVDELTFKRFYKIIESSFPQAAEQYKRVGFLITTTQNMELLESKEVKNGQT